MAVSNATMQAQIQTLTQKLSDVTSEVNTIKSALSPIISSGNASFLSGLSKLSHQTDANATDPNTGPYWGSGERNFINDLVNAVNNLQDNLQGNGFES